MADYFKVHLVFQALSTAPDVEVATLGVQVVALAGDIALGNQAFPKCTTTIGSGCVHAYVVAVRIYIYVLICMCAYIYIERERVCVCVREGERARTTLHGPSRISNLTPSCDLQAVRGTTLAKTCGSHRSLRLRAPAPYTPTRTRASHHVRPNRGRPPLSQKYTT